MRLILPLLLGLATLVQGEDSFYHMRIYRSLLQEFFSKNLKVIFKTMPPYIAVEDVILDDIGATVSNFHIKINPFTSEGKG